MHTPHTYSRILLRRTLWTLFSLIIPTLPASCVIIASRVQDFGDNVFIGNAIMSGVQLCRLTSPCGRRLTPHLLGPMGIAWQAGDTKNLDVESRLLW